MYAIRVEQSSRKVSDLVPTENADGDGEYAEVFRDVADDLDSVEFSAGNPRVEHITGVVHLYKRNEQLHDKQVR